MQLVTAFSPNMIDWTAAAQASVRFERLTLDEARACAPHCEGAVGHEDTARIISQQLGIGPCYARKNVAVGAGSKLLLAQYTGPRLEAGATELPPGAKITYLRVTCTRAVPA